MNYRLMHFIEYMIHPAIGGEFSKAVDHISGECSIIEVETALLEYSILNNSKVDLSPYCITFHIHSVIML